MGKIHTRYFQSPSESQQQLSDFHYINDREHRALYQRTRAYSRKMQLRRSVVVYLESKESASTSSSNKLFYEPEKYNLSGKNISLLTQLGFFSKYLSPQTGATSFPSILEQKQVVNKNPKYVRVEWNQEDQPTCGWLLSEVERMVICELRKEGQADDYIDRKWSSMSLVSPSTPQVNGKRSLDIKRPGIKHHKVIVALKSMRNLEALDQWLLEYQRPLFVLEQNEELQIVWGDRDQIVEYYKRPPSINNYEFVKLLGKGGFSKVIQVRNKIDGKLYAMKSLRKATRFELTHGMDSATVASKCKQIETEKKILKIIGNHPFLVRCHEEPFESKNYIHFVLDFCPGGELFFHLSKKGRFQEPVAKFYLIQVLLALEHLHAHNIIYRDLKPQNVLLDLDGHIRLTDFGLSRYNFTARDRSNSFCGSPQYISPEMLNPNKTHGRMVDFYSLGALFYEMLVGYPPFYSRNRQDIYQSVLYSAVGFPPFVSGPARQLIEALLVKNPDRRLGARNGVQDLKKHPYFSDVNWDKFLQKNVIAPLIPSIHSSNFDQAFLSQAPKFSLEVNDLGNNET